MAGMKVEGLCFSYAGYPETRIFKELDFVVPEGSFFSILGPSGGGKSTLLRLLAGLLRPASGRIVSGGSEVLAPGRERAMVLQKGGLFPWLTALGNVAFAAAKTHPGMTRQECRSFAAGMLERVGLNHAIHKWPAQLSGGMRQRVAIARALAMETDILLMDEPFSALDYRNRCLLQDLMAELWAATRKTIIFVTHDIDEALLLSDRILFIDTTRNIPVRLLPFKLPRPRTLLTSLEFCTIRKHFIALFNRTDLSGMPCL